MKPRKNPFNTMKEIPFFENHERFFSKIKVDVQTECWEWQASKSRDGYGGFTIGKNGQNGLYKAHRVAFNIFVGVIPEGKVIDHKCRNRKCCNPEHLEVVTPTQNTLENSLSFQAENAVKTHCPQGHEYIGENLKYYPNGGRYCRLCHRAQSVVNRRILRRKKAIRRLF